MNYYTKKVVNNFRKIFGTASEGILIVDADGCILKNNAVFDKLLGYERNELRSRLFTEIVNRGDKIHKFFPFIKIHHFQRSREAPLQMELINKEGVAIPVKLRSTLIKEAQGKVIGAIGKVECVRERNGDKKRDQTMWDTPEMLHSILADSGDGVLVADANGHIVIANEALLQLLGYREAEIIGTHLIELAPYKGAFTTTTGEEISFKEDFFSYQLEKVKELFERGRMSNYELYLLRKDRKVVPVEVTISMLRDQDKEGRGAIAICREITERKRTEKELKDSEERLKILFEFAPDAYYLSNLKGNFIDGNKAAERLVGYHKEELIGKNFLKLKLLPPEQIPKAVMLLAKNVLGQPTGPDEFTLNRKDGRQVVTEISTFPVKIKGQSLVLGIARDITERTRAEKELKKAHSELERRVEERTANLKIANEQLHQEIIERTSAEQKLIVYQEQLRSLASELSLTEERERRRIATDLHDLIGQALAIARIKLGALREAGSSIGLDNHIGEISDIIEQTIQDTQTLTFDLCPSFLYEIGFEKALELLAEETQKQHGITILFDNDSEPKPLDDDVCILLFRTVRELLINIVKHAHAHGAKVSLKREQDSILIIVEDDGIGFDLTKNRCRVDKKGGFGLFSIRERLNYLGGQIKVESEPLNGTRVFLEVPLRENGHTTKERKR